jgi:hypothetical protein
VQNAGPILGGKLHLRRALYLFPEVRAEFLCSAQIDTPPAHQLGKLGLDRGEAKQPGRRAGLKLHKEIDIAVGPLIPLMPVDEARRLRDETPAKSSPLA